MHFWPNNNCHTLYFFLFIMILFGSGGAKYEMKKEYFKINVTNVNHLFHKVAIRALIKAKAQNLIRELPLTEQIVYRECVKDGMKINLLARCVVQLFNTRDRMIAEGALKLPVEENYPKPKYYNLKKRKRINIPLKLSRIKRKKRDTLLYRFQTKTNFVMLPINEELERIRLQELKLPLNLRNLKRLERYQKMSKYVKDYSESLAKTNEKTLTQFNSPTKMKVKGDTESEKSVTSMFEQIVSFIQGLASTHKQKLSFLSPRLFNVIPGCNDQTKCKNRFLSPSMFSFHKNDGILPLPDIMGNVFSNSDDMNLWLNFLIEISGASEKLQKTVDNLGSKIVEMEEQIYPAIISMQRMEDKMKRIRDSYNYVQKDEIQRKGYTFMNENQAKLFYSDKEAPILKESIDNLVKMSKEKLEARIENDIRELAGLGKENSSIDWFKQIHNATINNFIKGERIRRATDPEANNSANGIHLTTLAPFAFYNRINSGVTLEIVTLSPHAFIFELMSSEALSFGTLNPRAFIASILTPSALIGRILSPGAFRIEVLSPRFLTLWVLSPEAGIIEILTPKFMDLKILSGERGIIQILSPRILSSHIYSPESDGILILSPSILSPGVGSGESQFIEILSPHILGGEGGSHGDVHGGHKETKTNETTGTSAIGEIPIMSQIPGNFRLIS